MTKYLCLALSVVMLGSTGTAGRLAAQHVAAEQSGDVIAEAEACALCHATHRGGGEQGLKLGADPSGSISGQVLSLGLTRQLADASLACLRCHGTPEDRARQREFGGRQPSGLSNRGYLGPDLTDDHPIGSMDRDPAMLPSISQPGALRPEEDLLRARLAIVGQPGDLRVECTTCHDPHDRDGMRLNVEEEQLLCTSCHDPGIYISLIHGTVGCSACHSVHGSGVNPRLLKAPDADLLCSSCHVAGVFPQSRAAPGVQFDTGPIAHLSDPKDGECATCHETH